MEKIEDDIWHFRVCVLPHIILLLYLLSFKMTSLPVETEDRCGVIVYSKDVHGNMCVLVVKGPSGKWSFPKGKRHEDETRYDAALRECKEETGLDLHQKISNFRVSLPYGTYYGFYYDAIYTEVPLGAPRNPAEIREVTWKSPNELLKCSQNMDLHTYMRRSRF